MPKIKNWEKQTGIGKSSRKISWENDNGSMMIVEKKGRGSRAVYDVYSMASRAGVITNEISVNVTNKEEARKKAVKWMKKHPNP